MGRQINKLIIILWCDKGYGKFVYSPVGKQTREQSLSLGGSVKTTEKKSHLIWSRHSQRRSRG